MIKSKTKFYFDFLLWIFILHTCGVAISLFIFPSEYLTFLGLEGYRGRFFQTQAGLFHLVLGVAYLLALYQWQKAPPLIFFAVIAKSIAIVFLVLYYFFFEPAWIILFSAFGDGLLGIALLLLYTRLIQEKNPRNTRLSDRNF